MIIKKHSSPPQSWFIGLVVGLLIGLLAYLSIAFYQGTMTLIKAVTILLTTVLFVLLIAPAIKRRSNNDQ